MTIASILNEKGSDVVALTLPTTIGEVCNTLRQHKIGAVLIRDGGSKVVGILSERDIVRQIADNGAAALDMDAASCMTSNIIVCSPNDTIQTAMQLMSQGRFRHMPVMDGDELKGMVSIGDLVKRRIAAAEQEAEDLKSYLHAS